MHATQAPTVASVDVQVVPLGQPLPPLPRQPSTQVWVETSQILPAAQLMSFVHATHVPAVASVDVQKLLVGHPLPKVAPRQPSTHVCVDASQILPLIGPPQLPSVVQAAHEPAVASVDVQDKPLGQRLPPLPRQPSTHAFDALQILPLVTPPQLASVTHCTQAPAVALLDVQTRPVGQPFPPTPRQPSTQV
jgi:hypothetical protein